MNRLRLGLLRLLLLVGISGVSRAAAGEVPEALRPWISWALWGEAHRHCPSPYSDPKIHRCFWPGRLQIQATGTGATFELEVNVYHATWVPLPGSADQWPMTVRVAGQPVAVLDHGGAPSIQLPAGVHRIEGTFPWKEIPQRLKVPREVGLLSLTLDGQPVELPVWDAEGLLWLKRQAQSDAGEKNFLSLKLNSELEDGIPLWWRSELDLTVSGQSREEDLGTLLPEGWKLAAVESPLPVAVDEAGRIKVQVRPGRWTVRTTAFRSDNPKVIRYAAGARPAVTEQLVAFRARPDLRVIELIGIPSMDVSQTAFPDRWRQLPVYLWKTETPFQIEERMRGMGDQKPAGLSIVREWWLDETGAGLTFRDRIQGERQSIWRLDAAPGMELGSVRSQGQGQLITLNPASGAPGVEVRSRNLNLEATGRMPRGTRLAATGWQADADGLQVTLHMPPGWRLFALFGADWVRGDWLTAWTLLDLFLLLIFALAVFRLWGWLPAVLAFAAFGLSYHEPGAPRFLWLVLLIPLALERVVHGALPRRILALFKWVLVTALVLVLVPFVAREVQQALYPQLETMGNRGAFGMFHRREPPVAAAESTLNESINAPAKSAAAVEDAPAPAENYYKLDPLLARRYGMIPRREVQLGRKVEATDNLAYDSAARIQTGPAVPDWHWRSVQFGWNSPVRSTQGIRPWLIPLGLERVLTVLRVALLVALAVLLLRGVRPGTGRRSGGSPLAGSTSAVAIVGGLLVLLLGLGATPVQAADTSGTGTVIPDSATLNLLRERLTEVPDAFPNAAEIPSASLTLQGRRLVMEVDIHTAVLTAVPLPGRLPAWSPVRVTVGDTPVSALRRDDGFLWLALRPGVHRVRVEGELAGTTDWEWSFLLKPRRVQIEAPGWTVTGVRPDGTPEAQVFFNQVQKSDTTQVGYDRQELQAALAVERRVELGLIWQVRTTVRRLSPVGRAVALRIPLLPGENVLTAASAVRDGVIDVRLGAQEDETSWEGSLAITNALSLTAGSTNTWVERWHLVASPVWNVTLTGLPPLFEADRVELVPVWHPWPGESVTLGISRPDAVAGATMTVGRASHSLTLGKRQWVSRLELEVRSSLGEDFLLELPAGAEVTGVEHLGKSIPVRQDSGRLVVPLRPGEQGITVGWKVNQDLGFRAQAGAVRLPADSANINTTFTVPDDRWVLWTSGPRRGPAVRFWVILICSLLAAVALGRSAHSPLKSWEWMLLGIGLTQVPLPAALVVVGWLFALVWRGQAPFQQLPTLAYNGAQVGLMAVTVAALGVLLVAVGEGLLGSPEMFIAGNGSSRTLLRWYLDRSGPQLPRPECYSISIWWYRFAMLLWALWLALSLIRWLRMAWEKFSAGGCFRLWRRPAAQPQPAPPPAPAGEAPAEATGASPQDASAPSRGK